MKNLILNWKTTLTGLVAIVLTLLFSTGTIDIETKQTLESASFTIAEHVEALIAVIAGVVLLFSKDFDSK